jgi:hypothetical protein
VNTIAVEYRTAPGFPNHRVGCDCSVWVRRGSVWRRLNVFDLPGPGITGPSQFVRLWDGSREHVRSVPLLRRAAFSPDPSLWLDRVGPRPHRAKVRDVPATDAPPIAAAPATVAAEPVALPPVEEPAPKAPTLRPVEGFEGYAVGSDRSLWTRWASGEGGSRRVLTDPPVWRRLPQYGYGGRSPRAVLYRDGRGHALSPERLYRGAFTPRPSPPPEPLDATGHLGTPAVGSAHGRAKLDEPKVIEARRLRAEGSTYAELARRFDVNPQTVLYAVTGVTWSHVPCGASS